MTVLLLNSSGEILLYQWLQTFKWKAIYSFSKKKVLFRNELDGNGDTDLLWEFQNKGVS